MGNSSVRLIVATLLSVPVVVGLFMIMHSLIDRDFENPEVTNRKIADLVQPDEEIVLEQSQKKPDKVEDPEEPPPELDTPELNLDPDIEIVNTAPGGKVDLNISTSGMSTGDGEYLPIVKVAPIYPRRAQTRGLEGQCLIQFTVTSTGATKDAEVVECTSSLFANASRKAVEKFKYKPRVEDGIAKEVRGVQHIITFKLED